MATTKKQPGYAIGARKLRVLLIESDLVFRRTLSSHYSRQGFTISVASNMTEALEFLSQLDFSLIVCNLESPLKISYKKLETILVHARKAKVLVTTSFSEQSIVDAVRLLGVEACLVKPFKRDTLLKATEQALLRKP
jgi:CheY-like chemotaxis protein